MRTGLASVGTGLVFSCTKITYVDWGSFSALELFQKLVGVVVTLPLNLLTTTVPQNTHLVCTIIELH